MRRKLTWGLQVCTYNRPQFLMECLRHALNQTRLPTEVVVVDASDYWKRTYREVSETWAEHWKTIRLVYEPARVRSLPFQRNQALEATRAEVVFSLDDDIYMYPDAAATIMEAYDRDVNEEIAVIGGHFVDVPPGAKQESESAEASDESGTPGLVGSIKGLLEDQMKPEKHFVPYHERLQCRPLPQAVEGLGMFPGLLVNGGRTTFRRRYGLKTRWSELLRYYASHEDTDFTYRLSRHGHVLDAPQAALFHADGGGERPDRFRVNTIRVRNLMALHRAWSDNRARSAARLARSFAFYSGLYVLVDPLRKRFTLPTARAYVTGLMQLPFYLFFPFENFAAWYAEHQQEMY